MAHNPHQPFSTKMHFKSMKVLDTNLSAQQSRKLLVCIIDKLKKGQRTISNASGEGHWKAPFLGIRTSTEGTNHGRCTKQTVCKRPSVLHDGVQSNWSVIDRALLSDPWRHPKSKLNRAFPHNFHKTELMVAAAPSVCRPIISILGFWVDLGVTEWIFIF